MNSETELNILKVIGIILCPVILPLVILQAVLKRVINWNYSIITYTGIGVASLIYAYIAGAKHSSLLITGWIGNYIAHFMNLGPPPGDFPLKEYLLSGPWLFGIMCLFFAFFNSPDSAEMCAGIIGTEHSVKTTQVYENTRTTGEGSYRTTKEYKIHPDRIKELKNNVFVRYDKTHPEDLSLVKNEFVDMNTD